MSSIDLTLMTYVCNTAMNLEIGQLNPAEQSLKYHTNIQILNTLALMALEITGIIVGIVRMPFLVLAKIFTAPLAALCNKEAPEGTFSRKILNMNDAVQTGENFRNIRFLIVALVNTILLSWWYPLHHLDVLNALKFINMDSSQDQSFYDSNNTSDTQQSPESSPQTRHYSSPRQYLSDPGQFPDGSPGPVPFMLPPSETIDMREEGEKTEDEIEE